MQFRVKHTITYNKKGKRVAEGYSLEALDGNVFDWYEYISERSSKMQLARTALGFYNLNIEILPEVTEKINQ